MHRQTRWQKKKKAELQVSLLITFATFSGHCHQSMNPFLTLSLLLTPRQLITSTQSYMKESGKPHWHDHQIIISSWRFSPSFFPFRKTSL